MRHTSVEAVMGIVGPLLRLDPKLTPRVAVNKIRDKCGLTIPYNTCWRAIHAVKKLWLHDDEMSVQLIHGYLMKLRAKNPGTVTSFQRINVTFQRAFLAFGVGRLAFPNLLPAVIIDACHMKSKQAGIIFAATGVTGEKHNFPLAIGIAPTENEDNWRWFLENLVKAIPAIDSPNVVITSDRDKGLKAALKEATPLATKCICLEHLKRNVQAKFNTGKFRHTIQAAAKACTVEEYGYYVSTIRECKDSGEEVFQYLDSCKEEWANAYIHVPRFNILTSNSAESMNSTLENHRKGGYLNIFKLFAKTCGKDILAKHLELASLHAVLPECVQEKWSKVMKEGIKREVVQTGLHEFVVNPSLSHDVPDKSDRVVNLLEMTCRCGFF